MGSQELKLKLELIRKLEAEQAELSAQIEALKDSVKAEMVEQGLSSMTLGTYRVSWTKYVSRRFDVSEFRKAHEDMYAEYVKPVEASRFTVREEVEE